MKSESALHKRMINSPLIKMIIFTLLISKVITCIVAQKLISIPFQAVERRELKAAAYGNRHLGAPLANVDLAYLIQIEIGTPPQPFYLLLDTGSSSTWVPIVGCNRDCGYPYHTLQPSRSSTFNSSYLPFSIHYGEGFSSGYYAQDSVTVNGVTIPEVVKFYASFFYFFIFIFFITKFEQNFAVSNYNDGELTMDGAGNVFYLNRN
jgi:hypothetical protein